jgi:hypothetical protein|tara:strand:- start:12949 stop:13203 length:255 start_codon:yes stop_codon:yes gene_type:complete
MRNIIKAIIGFGIIAIIFSTKYFILLYDNFTQLIISLGVAGLLVFTALIYIYNWMKDKDKEFEEMNKAIDMTRDYVREVEKKIK